MFREEKHLLSDQSFQEIAIMVLDCSIERLCHQVQYICEMPCQIWFQEVKPALTPLQSLLLSPITSSSPFLYLLPWARPLRSDFVRGTAQEILLQKMGTCTFSVFSGMLKIKGNEKSVTHSIQQADATLPFHTDFPMLNINHNN